QHLATFVLSEGTRYRDLRLASDDLQPRKAPDSPDDGLDGWAYMMRTDDGAFALLYFEHDALRPRIGGFTAGATYRWSWYDPRTGTWGADATLTSDATG